MRRHGMTAPLSAGLICILSWYGSSLMGQTQPTNRYAPPYQPVTTPNPAGLPYGSAGLEQPVYVADRALPPSSQAPGQMPPTPLPNGLQTKPAGAEEISSKEFWTYLDPEVGTAPAPQVDYSRFEAATLVAVVGREPILIGDLFDPRKITTKQLNHPSFDAALRKSLAEKIVKKALAQRFINEQLSGKTVKERSEAEVKMKSQVTKIFYNEMLPSLMKEQKCDSIDEFCNLLEKQGMTLGALKDNYSESMLAEQCVREKVPKTPSVSLEELRTYYETHSEDFRFPAEVKFQILTASFSKQTTPADADRQIRELGDQVFYGTPFETVAKTRSTGLNAAEGGLVDWTPKGALKSKVIEDTVFSIEPNKLSLILQDDNGFHIVRVLERRPDRVTSFEDEETQSKIRKKIQETKKQTAKKEFVEKVKQETVVWTKWPEDFPGARPLSELE
jgi:hypothetical protein